MHTTAQLIDLAKQRLAVRHRLPLPMSDYRLGKLLNIKQQTVSRWSTGKGGIGTEFAQTFAEACELPEAYVYACIEHERAKEPSVLRILEGIADAARHHAAAIVMAILAAGSLFAFPGNQAVAASSDSSAIYIMRSDV